MSSDERFLAYGEADDFHARQARLRAEFAAEPDDAADESQKRST